MQRHPILLQTCARATTAEESRFRINYPELARRDSRIIALDDRAADIVRRLAGLDWRGGHFLTYEESVSGDDATLRDAQGQGRRLSEEVEGADVVVMIATAQASPQAAELVGDLCADQGVMSAALVVAEGEEVDEAIYALRPNAMVLVILKDENDIPDMLTALRA
jgi:hypothetical protein